MRDSSYLIERCSRCEANGNVSAHEPLTPALVPEYPFQKVEVDLLALDGITCLLTANYYLKWLLIVPLEDTKTINVIRELNKYSLTSGRLVSDNDPQH